ncbi:MAG: hypothetical protein KDB07_09440, partial [Planctomycetes bacterium]|nr:hypothetical protein [Planctomycetota bacterium]
MADSPRRLAFAILRSFDTRRDNLDEALNAQRQSVDPTSAGVAKGICEDVLRHAALIDHIISMVSTVQPNKMQRVVLSALRVGVTSFVRGDPAHAAVSETVNLLKPKHDARKLVNAVMRRITEALKIRILSNEEALELRQNPFVSTLIDLKIMPWGDRFAIETEFDYFPDKSESRFELLSGFPNPLWKKLRRILLPEELAQVALAATVAPRVWFRMRDGRQQDVEKVLAKYESVLRLDDDSHERFDGTSSADLEMRGLALGVKERLAHHLLHSHPFKTVGLTVQD